MIFRASSPKLINGHSMVLSDSTNYPPLAMASNKYEEKTSELIESLCCPGMRVVDVGAHVGYFTLLAARQVEKSGVVYSFEPEGHNYELLLKNIQLNGYQNIRTINKGIADTIGARDLFISGLDNGRNSFYSHAFLNAGLIHVETTTIDDFLASEGWPTIDLIKIDVEGSEPLVWAGMSMALSRLQNLKVIIEFNPILLRTAGFDPLQFLHTLVHNCFVVRWIDESFGLRPLDITGFEDMSKRLESNEGSINLYLSKEESV